MDVEERAKTITQMTGRQVVEIYNYIKSFEREISKRLYLDGLKDVDIFSLICEIFNGIDFLRSYTKKGIKNLYENNI